MENNCKKYDKQGVNSIRIFFKKTHREEKLKTSRQNWKKKKIIEKDVYMAAYKKNGPI